MPHDTGPRFSVILPTYNRSYELYNALCSLRVQAYRNFETVVINDGGLDVAGTIRESGLEDGVTVLLLDGHRDTGPSAARNRGLAAATGDIIAYLDDDDTYKPDHLQIHAERYDSPNAHVVYSDAERCIVSRLPDGSEHRETDLVHSREHDRDAMMIQNYIPMLCLSHRRKCLERTGVFEESLTSLVDWDLFLRLSEHYDFAHVKKTTGTYYEMGFGSSVQECNRSRFVENLNTVYNRSESLIIDDDRKTRIRDMRIRHLGRMMFDTGVHLEQVGDHEEALAHFSRAAEIQPNPKYYLAMAGVQKRLGRNKDAIVSMHLAQYCLNPDKG